jgi:type I restriction enzyme M protein
MRANMDAFGKTKPLTVADFKPFEKAFGSDPYGKARRKDEGDEGRFRFFSREWIAARGDNLDIAWLRDTSNDPEDELREAENISLAIARHLQAALEEIETIGGDLLQVKAKSASV